MAMHIEIVYISTRPLPYCSTGYFQMRKEAVSRISRHSLSQGVHPPPPPPPEMHRRPLRRHVSFVTFQKPELPPQMSNDSRARHLGRVYGAKYQSRSNASTRELFDPICQSLARSYLVESTSRRHITRREVPRSRSGSRFVTSESYQ